MDLSLQISIYLNSKLFKEAETIKQQNPGMLSDKETNKKEIIEFIQNLFIQCDNEERENRFT
jgi:hypothetical protein